jgi:diadenosine tetraphosphate (Ap4A) HIT family hydrolase
MHQAEEAVLKDVMAVTRSVASTLVKKLGVIDYNILQNNGRLAHQVG